MDTVAWVSPRHALAMVRMARRVKISACGFMQVEITKKEARRVLERWAVQMPPGFRVRVCVLEEVPDLLILEDAGHPEDE